MIITAIHSEGILSITCRINGGLTEGDVAYINLQPNASMVISDRFATSPELVEAESAGLITTTEYETTDLSAMNKEKTIEVVERDVTYGVNVVNIPEVQLSDQTTISVNLRFIQELNTITLASDTSIDDKIISLEAGHNIVVGNTIYLKSVNRYYQGIAIAVNGNDITLDIPLDYAFTTSSYGLSGNHNMNVNGSETPITFSVSPRYLQTTTAWDITRVIFHMTGSAAMDDELFGDQDPLMNGIVVRHIDGITKNILNAKTNGDLLDFCNTGDYNDRAGGKGVYGFRCVKVFGGQQNDGVVVRLSVDNDDKMQVIIYDDLTGLSSFHVSAIGHLVD